MNAKDEVKARPGYCWKWPKDFSVDGQHKRFIGQNRSEARKKDRNLKIKYIKGYVGVVSSVGSI